MARLTVSLALLLTGLTTSAAHAQSHPPDDSESVAAEAGVDVRDLQDALATLQDAGYRQVSARDYLISTGELAGDSPAPDCGLPICGPLGQRIWCIEGIESHHGVAMWNPTPIGNGEHAQGYLGFLPSTARVWGAVIGNRASEWNAAARMLSTGAGRQFYGVSAGIC